MESNKGHNDIHIVFEFTFEKREKLEEVLKSLVTSGALNCAPHEYEDDGSETSRYPEIRTIPDALTTEVGEIKKLSTTLETPLNSALEMLEDDACVKSALTTTATTFERHIVDMARFLDPDFPITMKAQIPAPRSWWHVLHHAAHDIRPTGGQKRRLRSLHAAYLTLMFTLYAEHLFCHENTPEAHDLNAQELNSGLLLAIKTFDTNWLKLKHDRRVSGQPAIPKNPQTERPEQKLGAPDMWCAIVQARALLALALARAALVTSVCGSGQDVIDCLVGYERKSTDGGKKNVTRNSSAVNRARQHLAEAAELAGWTWRNRMYCSKKAKDAVSTWHERFWPLFTVIESGVLYAAQTSREYGDDVLREPVFTGPARVKLRWDYQCIDLDVAYVYDLTGMD
ncbi:hypothetical protein LTR70_010408 [Exophiala xenobiotica]|uniref:Uncharacterized protein n=1 Tax=Lithohypha guttulata TaxID=1690604 RepID=A0ABR0JUH1_9EURO|nr:hypothetical protein LTR24_010373 [Lithohypha guttulata]KAK5309297.1 hypothetical protein LTR70_010408 [Exophiala xenobiotica]